MDETEGKKLSKDEEATKLQNYSVKILGKEEPEENSYGGLRLNGAAQQKAANHTTIAGKQGKFTQRLLLKLAMHENLKAMNEALDDYIENLGEEIAVLEVERDQAASELEAIENELAKVKRQLLTAREAIEIIDAGEELELDASGSKLKNTNLEALISGYEATNSAQVDRYDTARLLAILRVEEERLEQTKVELGDEKNAARDRLNELEEELSNKRTELDEAKELQEEIQEIDLISNEAEREVRLSELLEKTPEHLLKAIKSSGSLEDELRTQIEEALESKEAAMTEADAFLNEIESTDIETPKSNPLLPKLG